MAVRRNADGSITVGVIPEDKPKKEPAKVETVEPKEATETDIASEAPKAEPKKTAKKK